MVTVKNDIQVNIEKSIAHSLKEVEAIRKGKLPKRSYRDMLKRVRENLKEDK